MHFFVGMVCLCSLHHAIEWAIVTACATSDSSRRSYKSADTLLPAGPPAQTEAAAAPQPQTLHRTPLWPVGVVEATPVTFPLVDVPVPQTQFLSFVSSNPGYQNYQLPIHYFHLFTHWLSFSSRSLKYRSVARNLFSISRPSALFLR